MNYTIQFTDDEVKILCGILGEYIRLAEQTYRLKDTLPTARDLFQRVLHAEESCPDVICEDCTKHCGIKELGLVEEKK